MQDIAQLAIIVIFSAGNLWVSRRFIGNLHSHGFYRMIAWEAILILVIMNLESWFVNPLSFHQIVSWILLFGSIYPAIQGFRMLKKSGYPDARREDASLLGIERTTELVTSGIYRRIRHPLYGSLIYFSWGVFLKNPSLAGLSLGLVATFFLTMTARVEELENLAYFGDTYRAYMKNTKMFIPWIF